MPARTVSIHQSAINGFIKWVSSQIGIDTTVDGRWPNPAKTLPPKAITIIPSGPRIDDYVDPILLSQTPVIGSNPAVFMGTYLTAVSALPVQLDIWTTYADDRDDLLARMEPILHASTTASLKASGGSPVGVDDPVRNGVLVNLPDPPWNGTADFFFDSPDFTDNPDSVQRQEFRATYKGECRLSIAVQATSPQLATVQLQVNMNNSRGSDLITVNLTTKPNYLWQEIGY
jgi:hypothetical protein